MASYEIVGGPSKMELMLALFDLPGGRDREVEFRLVPPFQKNAAGRKQMATIIGVERDDRSGESWNLEGYLVGGESFKAHYRTDRRTGVLWDGLDFEIR